MGLWRHFGILKLGTSTLLVTMLVFPKEIHAVKPAIFKHAHFEILAKTFIKKYHAAAEAYAKQGPIGFSENFNLQQREKALLQKHLGALPPLPKIQFTSDKLVLEYKGQKTYVSFVYENEKHTAYKVNDTMVYVEPSDDLVSLFHKISNSSNQVKTIFHYLIPEAQAFGVIFGIIAAIIGLLFLGRSLSNQKKNPSVESPNSQTLPGPRFLESSTPEHLAPPAQPYLEAPGTARSTLQDPMVDAQVNPADSAPPSTPTSPPPAPTVPSTLDKSDSDATMNATSESPASVTPETPDNSDSKIEDPPVPYSPPPKPVPVTDADQKIVDEALAIAEKAKSKESILENLDLFEKYKEKLRTLIDGYYALGLKDDAITLERAARIHNSILLLETIYNEITIFSLSSNSLTKEEASSSAILLKEALIHINKVNNPSPIEVGRIESFERLLALFESQSKGKPVTLTPNSQIGQEYIEKLTQKYNAQVAQQIDSPPVIQAPFINVRRPVPVPVPVPAPVTAPVAAPAPVTAFASALAPTATTGPRLKVLQLPSQPNEQTQTEARTTTPVESLSDDQIKKALGTQIINDRQNDLVNLKNLDLKELSIEAIQEALGITKSKIKEHELNLSTHEVFLAKSENSDVKKELNDLVLSWTNLANAFQKEIESRSKSTHSLPVKSE